MVEVEPPPTLPQKMVELMPSSSVHHINQRLRMVVGKSRTALALPRRPETMMIPPPPAKHARVRFFQGKSRDANLPSG
uniref:Uncharacterized protein n=1 Tax=Leersia perrieri TaxID=77586 RepID=A0A0D9XHC3_9ORYZ